ncbi:MAG: hypothetical protein J0626_06165, partial [Rhodospirillaceae bacterium]|nr:hypothetical protein [Rhodospirillaceae bacterium]
AHSKRNKMSMREIHALLAEHPQILHCSFHHIQELTTCLAQMAAAEVTHLVISGGDGTVLAVVSALLNDSPFKVAPCLSLLSAGMTNVIAHEVGQPGLPATGLKCLNDRCCRSISAMAASSSAAFSWAVLVSIKARSWCVVTSTRWVPSKPLPPNWGLPGRS